MPEIKTMGVAGAGTMGAGIAIVAARAGFETVNFDLQDEILQDAQKQTAAFFGKSVERGKLTQDDVDAILGRMRGTTSLQDLSDCDVVIEAVFEDLDVKQALFTGLNDICPAETIFATNTSTGRGAGSRASSPAAKVNAFAKSSRCRCDSVRFTRRTD